jgi:hypothetical protein
MWVKRGSGAPRYLEKRYCLMTIVDASVPAAVAIVA